MDKRAMHVQINFLILKRVLQNPLERLFHTKEKIFTQAGPTLLVIRIRLCEICFGLMANKQVEGHVKPW